MVEDEDGKKIESHEIRPSDVLIKPFKLAKRLANDADSKIDKLCSEKEQTVSLTERQVTSPRL